MQSIVSIAVHKIDDGFQKHVNLILEYFQEAFDYLGVTLSCANAAKPVVFHCTHARNLKHKKRKLLLLIEELREK